MGRVIFVEGTQKVHRVNWWYVVWVLAILAFGVFVFRPDLLLVP